MRIITLSPTPARRKLRAALRRMSWMMRPEYLSSRPLQVSHSFPLTGISQRRHTICPTPASTQSLYQALRKSFTRLPSTLVKTYASGPFRRMHSVRSACRLAGGPLKPAFGLSGALPDLGLPTEALPNRRASIYEKLQITHYSVTNISCSPAHELQRTSLLVGHRRHTGGRSRAAPGKGRRCRHRLRLLRPFSRSHPRSPRCQGRSPRSRISLLGRQLAQWRYGPYRHEGGHTQAGPALRPGSHPAHVRCFARLH